MTAPEARMSRKPIQIAAAYDHAQAWGDREPMWQPGIALYALCDDGSIWTFYPGTNWEPMPAIPSAAAAAE